MPNRETSAPAGPAGNRHRDNGIVRPRSANECYAAAEWIVRANDVQQTKAVLVLNRLALVGDGLRRVDGRTEV